MAKALPTSTSDWTDTLERLVARASADLPADIEQALRHGLATESAGSNAARALETILENIALARSRTQPLCQDTGALLFWVDAPDGLPQQPFHRGAAAAIVKATAAGLLRQNCVDSLSGRNSGNNLGPGSPRVHWETVAERDTVQVTLLLKGGGSENTGAQYSLPHDSLKAGRDLEGVRRCLLDAVHQAQGMGCAPGILGVCIGGDRASGYDESKRQLLRPLGQPSAVPALAELEARILHEANTLGIGPMGYGGNTTLLGCAIGALNRVPASFFVSVSYMCWACRRHTLEAHADGHFRRWLT